MNQSAKRTLWRNRIRTIIREFIQFGLVGAVGFLVDIGVYNLLRQTVFNPETVPGGTYWASIISTGLAILVNWLGNRYWTFRNRRSQNMTREGAEFFAVSILGALIPTGILWISHDAMGLTSQLADNIAKNVIGLAIGSLFRFTLYRLWVYNPYRKHHRLERQRADVEAHAASRPQGAEEGDPVSS